MFSTLRNISRLDLSSGLISVASAIFNIIESPNAHYISIQIANSINIGPEIAVAVVRASVNGASNDSVAVNSATNDSGNNANNNIVFILFVRIWSYTVFICAIFLFLFCGIMNKFISVVKDFISDIGIIFVI